MARLKLIRQIQHNLQIIFAIVILLLFNVSHILSSFQLASATNSTLNVTEDAFLASGGSGDTNFGSSSSLQISASTKRTLLKFDTASIPSNATINGVILRINQTESVPSGSIQIHEASSSWSENTVTWNNQPTWDSNVIASSATPIIGSMDISLPTSVVTPGDPSVSFGLDYNVSSIVAKISSKESTSTPAQLVIDFDASEITNTNIASEDSYIKSSLPDDNYGSGQELYSSSSTNKSLLKFNTSFLPAGTTITSVKLKLFATTTQLSGGIDVYSLDSAWDETTVTWNNSPTWGSSATATTPTPVANTWIETSISPSAITVGNESVTFGLQYNEAGTVAKVSSKESGTTAPVLEVTYTPVSATANLAAVEDTYVNGGSGADTNYGQADPLYISSSNNNSLLKFDTSSIPVGASISNAKLVLDQTVSGIQSGGIQAHPSAESWSENIVTYNNQPTIDSYILGVSDLPTVGDVEIVLNSADFVPGESEVAYRLSYSGSGIVAKISSRESTTSAPQLIIDYVVSSATPSPTATTDNPTNIGENSATLHATLNPNGQETYYHFEYYHNENQFVATPYVSTTTSSSVGSSTLSQSVSFTLNQAFAAGVTYYYRVVATNIGGTSYGNELSFTTASPTTHVIAAGGDMACDPSHGSFNSGQGSGTNCRQMATSDSLVADSSIEAVLPLGDVTYECGSPGAFDESYDPSWGRVYDITYPTPGNHEYARGNQVLSSYCHGTLVADAPAGVSQISVDRGPGGVFPSSGSFRIRIIDAGASCGQKSTDDVNCWDLFNVSVTANPDVWDISRIDDGTPELSFVSGDLLTYDIGTDARGYYGYFGDRASPMQPGCIESCAGYYSYNIGNWHLIALNSNCNARDVANGNNIVGCKQGTAQYQWLENDLKTTSPGQGILFYTHHPRVSSGDHGDFEENLSDMWNLLRSYNADITLAGHDHNYERFKQLGYSDANYVITPDTGGIRAWVVGNSGKNLISDPTLPRANHDNNRELFDNTTAGILKLTLGSSTYDWEFVAADGTWNGSLTDTGQTTIHTN